MITKPLPEDYEPARTLQKVVKDEAYHKRMAKMWKREREERKKLENEVKERHDMI